MPQFDIPTDAPWWAVILLAAFVITGTFVLRSLPRDSQHRLDWWREFFNFLRRKEHAPPQGRDQRDKDEHNS